MWEGGVSECLSIHTSGPNFVSVLRLGYQNFRVSSQTYDVSVPTKIYICEISFNNSYPEQSSINERKKNKLFKKNYYSVLLNNIYQTQTTGLLFCPQLTLHSLYSMEMLDVAIT